MIGIFDKTKVNDLNFALDTLSVKNNGISRNIANQDTCLLYTSDAADD